MSVEHVSYNGKRLPVKLGYYALKMLQKDHGISMENMDGSLEMYEPLLYYALKQGFKIEKKEFKFEMEDMVDILDDCFFEFAALIPKFFPEELLKMTEAGGKAIKNPKK